MSGIGEARLRTILSWLVIALLVVPVGGALWLGVAVGESPCILCWAQRTSMILIALVALFVVRYGPRPRYLGVLILLGAWGIWMATRHSSLHLARDIGQGFAIEVLGAHTYTWAWVIHWIVLLVAGKLLFFYRGSLGDEPGAAAEPVAVPGRAGRFAMGLFVVLVGANAVQAFVSTGPPPFLGQGDPVRLSLDPGKWVWSTGEYKGALGWRGSWAVPEPNPSDLDVDPDPANGPLTGLPALSVLRQERITAAVPEAITGFAVGPDDRVLLTTEDFGVYVLDGTLSDVMQRVVIDPGFSIDVTPLVGATFLGPDTLAVGTVNKSYILLQPDPDADPDREWRHFLETTGDVTELRRSRFATVRARLQYALSLAYDPAADELITVSVPSELHPRLVVSRFDRRDFILSSEFLPGLAPQLTLAGPQRGLGEYRVTGAAVADGRLYALSPSYSTLLVIDLASRTVTAAYAVPGLEQPTGLAARGEELLITEADGRLVVIGRPRD